MNCLGVRAGGRVQSVFMVLRIVAIATIVVCGARVIFWQSADAAQTAWFPVLDRPLSFDLLTVFGATMIPVLFGYGGWQTSNYVAGEIREPRKNLPRALLLGVIGMIVLYLTVNFVYVQALSPVGSRLLLLRHRGDASRVRLAAEARLSPWPIAISTLGFLSQALLSYPRVAFAMADDGVLPRMICEVECAQPSAGGCDRSAGRVDQRHGAAGDVRTDSELRGGDGLAIFRLVGELHFCVSRARMRRRGGRRGAENGLPRAWTSVDHGRFCRGRVARSTNTIYKYPRNAGIALCILFAGVPVYFLFRGRAARPPALNKNPLSH